MSDASMVKDVPSTLVTELAGVTGGQPLEQNLFEDLCRFMIYFSLAESKLATLSDGLGGTDELARQLIASNGFDSSVINDSHAYFVNRYRDQADSERRFRKLAPSAFVGARQMTRFVALLNTPTPSTEEKISLVFKVIFRLRHNLFHGEKWSYNLEGQGNNISKAVNVLRSTLTLTRGRMWQP